MCTSRIYVERSIYPEFLERFVAAARKWRTGDPSDGANNNGALISKEHLEKVVEGPDEVGGGGGHPPPC